MFKAGPTVEKQIYILHAHLLFCGEMR